MRLRFSNDAFDEFLRCQDSSDWIHVVSFEFDSDVTFEAGIEHDFHHALIVDVSLVAFVVEVFRFSANDFGGWHEVLDSLVGVIVFEILKIRKAAAVRAVDYLHEFSEPFSIAGVTPVIFHDDVHLHRLGNIAERVQSVSGMLLLFIVFAWRFAVDPNGRTAERFRRFQPYLHLIHGLGAFLGVRGIERYARTTKHHGIGDAEIVATLLQLSKKAGIACFIFDMSVKVLEGFNTGSFHDDFRVVEDFERAISELAIETVLLNGQLEAVAFEAALGS